MCHVRDEGLKVDAKNCVTASCHLGDRRSVDTPSLSHAGAQQSSVSRPHRVIAAAFLTSQSTSCGLNCLAHTHAHTHEAPFHFHCYCCEIRSDGRG